MNASVKADIIKSISRSEQLASMQAALADAFAYSVNDPHSYYGAIMLMENLLEEHSKQLRSLLNKI